MVSQTRRMVPVLSPDTARVGGPRHLNLARRRTDHQRRNGRAAMNNLGEMSAELFDGSLAHIVSHGVTQLTLTNQWNSRASGPMEFRCLREFTAE